MRAVATTAFAAGCAELSRDGRCCAVTTTPTRATKTGATNGCRRRTFIVISLDRYRRGSVDCHELVFNGAGRAGKAGRAGRALRLASLVQGKQARLKPRKPQAQPSFFFHLPDQVDSLKRIDDSVAFLGEDAADDQSSSRSERVREIARGSAKKVSGEVGSDHVGRAESMEPACDVQRRRVCSDGRREIAGRESDVID